jgi:hypothetical protein
MKTLDGNALAGALFDHFGHDMTGVRGSCAHCGASARVAELRVYVRAPGKVARCPVCGDVALVFVNVGEALHADLTGFRFPSRKPG